ncbi:hypothetical protein K8R33_03620 [archaeon]|nr:hypothetical protein [archaeon]
MRGVIIILLLMVLVFSISGCNKQTAKTNMGGVDLEFTKNNEFYSSCKDSTGYCLDEYDEFGVDILLTNNLPKVVEGATLCVSDLASASIGGIPKLKPCIKNIEIPAATVDSNEGLVPGVVLKHFPEGGGAYSYSGIAHGNDKTTINAELRYSVISEFKLNDVCVKLPATEIDFPCENGQTFTQGNIEGDLAPVIVEKVVKRLGKQGNKAVVKIDVYLKKDSKGSVFWEDTQDHFLKIEAQLGNQGYFNCDDLNSKGLLDFSEGLTKVVSCDFLAELGGQGGYPEAIFITLVHDYYVLLPSGTIKLVENEEGLL